jgi:transposase
MEVRPAIQKIAVEHRCRYGYRRISAEFIAFLAQLLSKTRRAKEIHIVLDNLSAHKTPTVEEFLAQHPKVRFHFPPTYCSGLNQVELWFSKIQRDLIRRDVFTSVADLARKLRKYIEAYAKLANPFAGLILTLKSESALTKSPGLLTSCASMEHGRLRRCVWQSWTGETPVALSKIAQVVAASSIDSRNCFTAQSICSALITAGGAINT